MKAFWQLQQIFIAFPKWKQITIYARVLWMESTLIDFPIKKHDKDK